MYADTISDSMDIAIKETKRRREIQDKYNKEHGIIPKTIIKEIKDTISNNEEVSKKKINSSKLSKKEKEKIIDELTQEMRKAASELDFERATELRDIIFEMQSE